MLSSIVTRTELDKLVSLTFRVLVLGVGGGGGGGKAGAEGVTEEEGGGGSGCNSMTAVGNEFSVFYIHGVFVCYFMLMDSSCVAVY